jgi:uncharacterized membrane protein YdjX (TVP38/TMEM64 family)
MRRPLRVLAVLAVLALPFVLGQLLPLRSGAAAVVDLLRGGSALGVALYVASNAVGAVLTVPMWLFTGMAGYVFGPVRGVLLASPASVLAMTSTFLLGRFVLSRRIARWLEQSPRLLALHGAVSADAFRIGLLLRVSPIAPQNLFSYGLSVTRMRVGTFMLVTWLGLLPMICFQVYLGSLMHDVAELVEGKRPPLGPWGWVATVAGALVTAAALAVIARLGQRALARHGV